MEYYNPKYLIIFLMLTGVNVYLNNAWTLDKGYLLLIAVIWGTISFLFWLILSTISYLKNAQLKNELFYYIGIGAWNILMTIEYFKLEVIKKSYEIIHWIPYFLVVLFCLLPIKFLWYSKKDIDFLELNEIKKK